MNGMVSPLQIKIIQMGEDGLFSVMFAFFCSCSMEKERGKQLGLDQDLLVGHTFLIFNRSRS